MPHVVLLGDSIFDNGVYVPGGPAFSEQLRAELPGDWTVTLLAVDGDVTNDVARQIPRIPDDATHLVVSCGGNDALGYLPVLAEPADSVAEVLARFGQIRVQFRNAYRRMLDAVTTVCRTVTVCTVYDQVPDLGPTEQAALAMFNEVILREAVAAAVGIVDLRLVCTERSDYSEVSPIEPSRLGGAKIAVVLRNRLLAGESPVGVVPVHYWTATPGRSEASARIRSKQAAIPQSSW